MGNCKSKEEKKEVLDEKALADEIKELSSKQVLVKNMQSLAKWHQVTCVCLETNGVVTEIKPSVNYLWYNRKILRINDDVSDFISPGNCGLVNIADPTFELLMKTSVCSIGSEMQLTKSMEAILNYFDHIKKVDVIKSQQPQKGEEISIPFYAEKGFFGTVRLLSTGEYIVQMLGTPDKILAKCTKAVIENKEIELSAEYANSIKAALSLFDSKGFRAFAVVYCKLDPTIYNENFKFEPDCANVNINSCVFVGFIALQENIK
jgi:magnesium-transporting ATPase (P-type)